MTYAGRVEPQRIRTSASRFIASYDLGYEFTQQHYIDLQCMVEDADHEASTLAQVRELETIAS